MTRTLAAYGIGTALLVATVKGSGIMAERLSGGNTGLALVATTIATGAILVVLITIFGPVSGAHFNPVVTLVMAPPGAALAPLRPLCRRPDPWRRPGRGPGQPHVRPAAALSETVRGGTGQLIFGNRSHHRVVRRNLRRPRRGPPRHSLACWPYHHRGLVVHRFIVLREPRRDPGPDALGHLRRHRPRLCPGLPRRPTGRSADRCRAVGLALRA